MTQITYVSVAYAYPSSANAKRFNCAETGCYMVQYRYVGKAAHWATGPYDTRGKAQLVMTNDMVEHPDLVLDPISIAARAFGIEAANDL